MGSVPDWCVYFIYFLLLLFLIVSIRSVVESIWWRPKKLQRHLRNQGVKANPYNVLVGDIWDVVRMVKEAQSKPLPLFCHDIVPRVLPFLIHTLEKYGKKSLIWYGPTPRIIITDPEQIREVISSKFGNFEKPMITRNLGKFVLSGLFVYEGEKWAKHRRIINPAFHPEKLKNMLPAISTCCSNLIDRWKELVSTEESTELDIWPELRNFTGDIISRTAFGSNFEEGKRIFQLQDEQARLLKETMYYFFIPGYRYFPTKANKRKKEIEREFRAILRTVIGKRKKVMEAGVNSEDLLGYLMESNLQNMQGNESSHEFRMTTEEVIDECKLFYFAGHETTAVLLTWTLVLLSMYPSWQDRARQEILQCCGKNKPNIDDLNHLKIVTMILNEVLRLYPPAPYLLRCASKDTKLGELSLQQGVQVSLPVILIHHDPEYWGDDAHEFKPESFSEGVSKASKTKMAFFPFSGGPRVCIGQAFAMTEAKFALSMILQNFSFELSPSYIHAPNAVLTLHPQHGAPLLLHKI